MRHEQQCTGAAAPPVLEVFGEPVDGDHIQMIRGLVERQDVPVLEQQARQVGAAPLPAGERADFRVEVHAAQQRLHDLARLLLRRPFVVFAPLERGFAQCRIVVERIALREHAGREPVAARHTPGVGLLCTVEQLEQRGFAVAVAAHDANAVAFEHALRDVGEHGFCGECERYMLKSQVISRHSVPL